MPRRFPIRAVLLDLGDTLVDEARWGKEKDPLLPGVRQTLPLLAKDRRLAILSNSRSTTRLEMAAALEGFGVTEHLAAIVTSAEVGWRKPHPIIFEAALAALGSTAEETAMVGNDLEADISGAKAMGLRTIHLRWGTRYRLDPQSAGEEATVVISTFPEIPTALLKAEGNPPPARTALVDEEALPWAGLPP